MSELLFPEEETKSLSPRLKWLRRHHVRTVQLEQNREKWIAWRSDIGDSPCEASLLGADLGAQSGDSEDDAILELAKANNWRLWNEETPL